MAAYLCYSLVLTGFIYPVVVHAIWSSNGLLSAFTADPYGGIGVIDFAGSGVIHTTGGATALIATSILGARKGRFHDSRGRLLEKPRVIQGHSVALQLMGTMVLWFGCKLIKIQGLIFHRRTDLLTLWFAELHQGMASTPDRPFC
jgi:Amt family ammonium transporter